MTILLDIGARDAVLGMLQTYLPAELDAVDALFPDSITLDDPVEYLISEKALDFNALDHFPVLFVLRRDWTPLDFRLSENDSVLSVVELAVSWIVVHDGETAELEQRAERMKLAIWRLLTRHSNEAAMDGWSLVDPILSGSESNQTTDNEYQMQFGGLVFHLEKQETAA